MTLNLLIVEDSFAYALELQMLCEQIGYNVIGVVDNSAEALDLIISKQPDLILMDISINGQLNGVEVGKNIKHLNIPIIYLTSYDTKEIQEEAQQSNMIAFLIKPINRLNLASVLKMAIMEAYFYGKDSEIAIKATSNSPVSIYFRKDNLYHKVSIQEINYATSSDNYCRVFMTNGENFLLRYSLTNLEEVLPKKIFIRCHRQFIVHRHKIRALDLQNHTLWIDETEIPFSRNKKEELQRNHIFLK